MLCINVLRSIGIMYYARKRCPEPCANYRKKRKLAFKNKLQKERGKIVLLILVCTVQSFPYGLLCNNFKIRIFLSYFKAYFAEEGYKFH